MLTQLLAVARNGETVIVIVGGCLCGLVRYRAEGEPSFQVACHCTNCQKQSGSAFSVNIGVPRTALTITGELRTYVDHGDSGQAVQRWFCPACGSPIFSEIEADPGIAIVKAGTLDDASGVRPQRHIFCASRQAWVELPEDVPAFDRATPVR